MKRGRSIVVDGRKFRYRVGRETTVVRREDNTVFAKFANHVIRGVTPDTYARGQWKRTSDGTVYPGDLAPLIRRELAR